MTNRQENAGRQTRVALTLAVGVLLAACALRLWRLSSEPVWHDEGWSIRAVQSPFATPDDNTPALYYLAGHMLWRLGAGESPLAYRYTSVLIGLAVVALTLRLGWRWHGPGAGVAAGLLAASSPLLWEYSQEVRAYAAVPLAALGLLYGADRLLRHRPGERIPRRLWALVVGIELAGLYTHNLAAPLVLWMNTALIAVWALRRDRRHLLTWAGLQAALALLYLPWLLTQSPSGTLLNTPPEPGLTLAQDIWRSYFLPALAQLRNPTSAPDLLAALDLYGAFVLALAAMLAYTLMYPLAQRRGPSASGRSSLGVARDSHRVWLLLSHAVLVPALSTALLLAAHIDFHPRYYVAAVPGTFLLVVAALHTLTRRLPRPELRGLGYALAVLPGLFFAAASLREITSTRAYQHDDFAGLAAYYASLPSDAVILVPYALEPALQVYYAGQLGIQARFVNVPLYAGEAAAVEAINGLLAEGPRSVEFLTWFQLPADVRGMYPCLLAAASAQVGEPQTFFGLMTQRFDLFQPVEWMPLDAAPLYAEVRLESAAYAASRQGICVRTSWRLTGSAGEDLSVAASILNNAGGEIARADVKIAREDSVGMSSWGAGEDGQAYNLLQLPTGAAPAAYGLALHVYRAASQTALDVLDAAGRPAGQTYRLPEALNAAGPPFESPPDAPALAFHSAGVEAVIQTGVPFDVEIVLPASQTPGPAEVRLEGEGWSIQQPASLFTEAVLDWYTFVVPPGSSGQAVLRVQGHELARFTVVDPPRLFEAPPIETPVDGVFPGLAALVGAAGAPAALSPAIEPQVTLVWRAQATPDTAYTVFVQLIAEDGRVLAQSDTMPAGGARPTTGWMEGEYIQDTHVLRWNITGYSGPAYLIAGFYDAAGGFRRFLAENGADFVRLPFEIHVTP